MKTPVLQPKDGGGEVINRAMGSPIPCYDIYLGNATKFVDMITLTPGRVFHGIHIDNPSGATQIHICIGKEFEENIELVCPPQRIITIDDLTFGPELTDHDKGEPASRIRAKLSIAQGTAASGVIDYSGSGNPTDGMTCIANGQIFEFSTDKSAAPGNIKVDIGATADDSWTNFVAQLIANEQSMTAAINTGLDTVTVTSLYGGTYGNGFQLEDVSTGATFPGGNVLAGGSGGVLPVIHVW